MKKNLFLPMVLSLCFVGILQTSHAQADSMKTLPPVIVSNTAYINKEVTKSFEKDFKEAVDPMWYKMDKDYLVTFISNDMKNNALYKQSGKMVYNIQFGDEKNLPDAIKDQVHGAYADYKITKAVNVKMNNRDVWVVNLEGMKRLIIVRAEEGQLEEVNNYVKAS
jgi:hypothetical protein